MVVVVVMMIVVCGLEEWCKLSYETLLFSEVASKMLPKWGAENAF